MVKTSNCANYRQVNSRQFVKFVSDRYSDPFSSVFIRGFNRVHGQFNRKPAAFAGFAFDAYPTAVGLDDMFDEAQADSNTLRLAPQLGTAPVKPLENLFVFLRRYARAVVADRKDEGWLFSGLRTPNSELQSDCHRLALRRMFDGIISQVNQRLLDGPAIQLHFDMRILDVACRMFPILK